jgi:hypothetical protein
MTTIKHFRLAALATLLFLAACRKETTQTPTPPAPPDNDMVITPAGLMHRSNVHFVPPGSQLSVQKGRLLRVDSKSGKSLEDFGEVKITPTRIAAAVQGWIAYTYWSNPTTSNPITNFTTNWTVPSVPSRQGSQTIFLFNGMQDGTTSSSYIIQPVLQWGPSAAGGGKYWAITNWYVSSSQAFFGSLVQVSAGTSLTGVMKQTAVSGTNYSYNSSFTGYSSASALQVNNVPQSFWAAETLESYGVTTPSTMYPPNTDVAMKSIQILQGTTNAAIHWTTAQATSGAAQRAVVVSNSSPGGEVDIYFR